MSHKINVVTLVVLVSVILLDYAHSAALGVSGKDEADVESFMMQYGYLEPKNSRLGEFRTKKELDQGIEQLQEFAGLKVTGKVDEATVKLIRSPRCSMPDFGPSDTMKRRRKRYALHDSEWRKLHVTYRVYNTSTEELKKSEVRDILRKAFDMWTEVSPLTFTEIFTGDPDLRVSFERRRHDDGYPFDGRGGKIAHAFYPHSNIGLDGDIHFDDEEHWTLNKPREGTNFFWTAVHEIGHAIGVEHSTYYDAVMYPYYTGYKPNLKLHEDDIMAIQAKYGKPPVSTVPPTIDPSLTMQGPSPCNVDSFDAVFHSKDGNTYFFKEEYFWTLDKYDRMLGGRKIAEVWPKLRARVQAAYTRRDGKTVFFKGRRFWVYEGTKYVDGPKLITEYGLPLEMKRLDAAFIWGGNGKTYLFKGSKYWRYNEKQNKVDPGYPKNISEAWGAVRQPVDSVMTWKDKQTYFFKGKTFSKYEYHKWLLYKPEKISEVFYKCEPDDKSSVQVARGNNDRGNNDRGNNDLAKNGASRATLFAHFITLLTIVASFGNCW